MTDLSRARAGIEALAAGDLEGVIASWHPQIVAEDPSHAPDSGVHHGAEEILADWARFNEAYGDVHISVEDIVEVPPDRVLALLTFRLRAVTSDIAGAMPYALLLRVDAAGLVVHQQAFMDFDEARAAAAN